MRRLGGLLAVLLLGFPLWAQEAPPVAVPVEEEVLTGEVEDATVAPVLEPQVDPLEDCFTRRPATMLVDPQRLLTQGVFDSLMELLEGRAADSPIDLFIYLFGAETALPDGVGGREVVAEYFREGKPAVVVFYPMGQPQRAELHLSPALAEAVTEGERVAALAGAVAEAVKHGAALEQLESFVVRMGIQVVDFERMLDEPAAVRAAAEAAKAAAAKEKRKPSKWKAYIEPLAPVVAAYWRPAAWGLGVLLGVAGVVRWWMWRATYRLPEFEVEPRLGGDHGAGVGSVISFATPMLPPASQRKQTPDYLRRS